MKQYEEKKQQEKRNKLYIIFVFVMYTKQRGRNINGEEYKMIERDNAIQFIGCIQPAEPVLALDQGRSRWVFGAFFNICNDLYVSNLGQWIP